MFDFSKIDFEKVTPDEIEDMVILLLHLAEGKNWTYEYTETKYRAIWVGYVNLQDQAEEILKKITEEDEDY